MAGFQSRNEKVLRQWYSLFKESKNNCSPLAWKHWDQLIRSEFPSQQNEEWKHLPIDELLNNQFVLPSLTNPTTKIVSSLKLPLDAVHLVFIDGRFSPIFSDVYFDCFKIHIARVGEYCNLPEPIQSEVFLHLTESLSEQITIFHLSRNQIANRPLYLLHISSGCKEEAINFVHYRHHLYLESGSQARVIEHYVSLNEYQHFTGARLTMLVANNAKLTHIKFAFENKNSYHFSHNDIITGSNTDISSNSFLLGSSLNRHNTSVQLNGKNSKLTLNSFAFPVNQEIHNIRTFLIHRKGYCHSRQLHKIIACNHSRAIFHGLIKVAKHALNTDAKMTNNNLLLGLLAEIDSKPQLEIFTDDVKCSHGVTVGHIDKEQIFYLQTRGIDESKARYMIIYAFISELTENIENEILKKAVFQRIKKRFPGVFNEF